MAQSFRQLAGIPDATASPSDSVLIIIDAQNEYAKGALAVKDIDTSRPAIGGLLKKYRDAGGHIAHITHSVPEGTPVFTPSTDLAEEFDELKAKETGGNEVNVSKKFPGSFAETALGDIVKQSGKNKVVLCGYMAHVCVSTTAREAHQRGLEVLIAEDAVGDRDIPGYSGQEVTKAALSELSDFFATVVQSKDIK